jgi:hypothetical protein
MKKTPIISLLVTSAIFLFSNSYAQNTKVASVESKNFERLEEQKKEEELKLTKKELKEFDEKGRMLKHELYLCNPVGELIVRSLKSTAWEDDFRIEEISKYDETGDRMSKYKTFFLLINNRKTKVEFSEFTKSKGETFNKTYKYNKIGKPFKIKLTNKEGKKVGEELYRYNKLHEETLYKKWELNSEKVKYSETKKTAYTKDGYLASSESVIKDGQDTYKDIITFQRNKIKEHLKYKNGEQISSFGGAKATYDPSKARILIDFNNKKGGMGLWHNEDEYDESGNKVKTTQMVDDETTEIIHYKYDKYSNLTETLRVSYADGKESGTTKETVEYDVQNSVLRKTVHKDGNLISEHTYDYKYY